MKKHSLTKQKEVKEDKPNRASFHHGSTTQGGSDFGQGSNDLPNRSLHQGSESNDGSDYANEQGWDNEMLRRSDDQKPPNERKKNTKK